MVRRIFILTFISGFLQITTIANTYYVANSGDDNNTGTSPAMPWKTISKLNSILSNLQPGDQVLFNRGDIFEGEVMIPSGISGNPSAPILFGSYGSGDLPILSGSTSITDWIEYAPNIWKASIDHGNVLQVFENHRRLVCACAPNAGYYRIESTNNNDGFTDQNLSSKPDNFWKNASLLLHINEFWWEDAVIDSSNANGYVGFTYGSSTFNPLIERSGYFIENKLELIDTLNEWFFDKTDSALYLYSTVDPATKKIRASVYTNGIAVGWPWLVKYITIKDISFSEQSMDAVQLRGSAGLVIKNCSVYNAGQYGIMMSSDYTSVSRYDTIRDNEIRDCLSNGIYTFTVAKSMISKNILERSGLYPHSGGSGEAGGQSGMRLWFGDSLKITYNRIDSSGNCGIILESSYSTVEKNIIDHSMLLLSDGAAIYNNTGGMNIYRNNILRYTKGDMEAGAPGAPRFTKELYFDASGDQNSVVENNTLVSQTNNTGIGLTPNTTHMKIRNNVIYQCLRPLEIFNYDPGSLPVNTLEVTGNTFYSNVKEGHPYYIFSFTDLGSMFTTCDSNYVCNPYSDNVVEHFSGTSTEFLNFAQWKSQSNRDMHSKTSYVHWNYPVDSSFIVTNELDQDVTYSFKEPVVNLDNKVVTSLTLHPFTSAVLLHTTFKTPVVTGVNFTAPSTFVAYPNPVQDILLVQADESIKPNERIVLFDVTGQLIFSGNFDRNPYSIHTFALNDGMYLLKINNTVKKIIVNHSIK